MEKKRIALMECAEKVNSKFLFIFNAAIIFALTYYVAYKVPFQSDDYSYFQLGLSLDAHIKHYIGWSGRFITDYTSAILLNCFKRPIYMAINSCVLLVVVSTITILPNIVSGVKKITRGSSIILWIVFMLYWVSNPNLGQTSFWLVGSANYLWPLMWASMYFAFFLFLLVNNNIVKNYHYIILFLLGIFAGLSNEALGLAVILFTICMFFMFWKDKKGCLVVGLISSSIGYAFLYFAPGNYARLQNDAFKEWRDLSFVDKFLSHLFNRMPEALGEFYITYLVFIFILIITLYVRNDKKTNVKSYIISFVYCALSVCAVCAFVVAPAMPPRSGNTSLYFLLLAISFIANVLIDAKNNIGICVLFALTLTSGVYFIFSYVFVSYAYSQTKTQASIRESIIKEAKANRNDMAIIPDWYFTRLAKDEDKFDTFRSGAMPSYYGLNDIEWKDVTFNYAVIENTKPISVNEQLNNGLTLRNIYIKLNAPFEQTIVFEFDNSLMNSIREGDKILYIHLYADDMNEFINEDLNLNDFIQIGNKYYYGRTISIPHIDKLSYIDFGFYNPDADTNSASYILDLKKYNLVQPKSLE